MAEFCCGRGNDHGKSGRMSFRGRRCVERTAPGEPVLAHKHSRLGDRRNSFIVLCRNGKYREWDGCWEDRFARIITPAFDELPRRRPHKRSRLLMAEFCCGRGNDHGKSGRMSFQGGRCVERTAPGGSLFWRINTHAQAIVEILLLSCAAMKSVENMSIVEGIVLSHDHPSFRRACRINGHASDRLSRRCTHKRSRSCENPYRSTRFAPDAKAMIRLLSASSAPGAVRARWRPPSGRSRKVRALSGLR